jgi:hypothetical protein
MTEKLVCDSYKPGLRLAHKNDIVIIFLSLIKYMTSLEKFKRLLPAYNDLIIMAH